MDGMDRISQLPEPILQDVILLLPWEDAAHMCVLSKRFKDLWRIFPVFNFNFDQKLRKGEFLPGRKRKLNLQKGSKNLINVVDQALLDIRSEKTVIQRFRLCMYIDNPKDASRIDGWIELATKNCLQELDLEILYEMEDECYCFPRTTFATKTMEVLRLNGCKLEKPLFALSGKSSSLKVVSLVEVCLDDEFVNSFFAGCPSLEDFTLADCVGLKILVIPDLPKLRRLMVHHFKTFESINIEAANLESFSYDGCYDVLNISDATLKNLRELNLDCVRITDDLFEDLISKLPLLQNLALRCWSGVTRVKISHRLLEKLLLCLGRDMMVLEIDTPLLLSFEYGVHFHTLPKIFTINAPCLQDSYLSFIYGNRYRLNTLWFLSLRGYLSKFNQHNGIVLNSLVSITFDPDELTEVEVPPVPSVKQLKVQRIGTESNFEAILDGLLWSSCPDILVVPYTIDQNADFIRFLCEKLIDRREDPQCCIDSRMRCWRHYIQDVSAQGLMTVEDRNAFLSSSPSTKGPEVCFELKWDMND